MNKKPVTFLQTDPKWAKKPYQTTGETATIGGSGCGPTCAASVITSMTCRTFDPVQACKWSVDHGYKAKGQGTYYGYFAAQFKAMGIECRRLNSSSAYNDPNHPAHREARELLKKGWYIIACMGKGLWTSSGHFVVAWWLGDKMEIMDPSSTRNERCHGDPGTFFRQVKYYFAVNAVDYNFPGLPSFPAQWRVDATQGLNVRSGPGTNFPKSGKLAWGDDIQLIGFQSGWYKTPVGWISADYVVPVPALNRPAPQPPKPEPPKPQPKPEPPKPQPKPDGTIHLEMTEQQLTELIEKTVERTIQKMVRETAALPTADWAEPSIKAAQEWGITADGSRPQSLAQRQEVMAMLVKGMEHQNQLLSDNIRQMVMDSLQDLTVNPGQFGFSLPSELCDRLPPQH